MYNFLGMGCYFCSFLTTILTIPFTSSSGSQSVEPLFGLTFMIPFLVFGAIFMGGFAYIVYGIVGAIMSFQGKPFRYIIIGNRVERFMKQKQNGVINQ